MSAAIPASRTTSLMDLLKLHAWDLDQAAAVALQKRLAARVDTSTPVGDVQRVAGADVSYNRFSPIFYAVVLVLDARDWSVVEEQSAVGESPFPYIPGLLSFREAPVLLEAFAKVQRRPDVVMVDGQGIAHPRRLGIASHLGLWLDVPTIGCGKTRLTGRYDEPGPNAGDTSPLLDRGEVIGSVVRTKARTNPLFVSPGHKIDLASSVRLVLEACRGYRLPEPTRLAHLHVNEVRRRGKG
jgi:deoxyribonuclease V